MASFSCRENLGGPKHNRSWAYAYMPRRMHYVLSDVASVIKRSFPEVMIPFLDAFLHTLLDVYQLYLCPLSRVIDSVEVSLLQLRKPPLEGRFTGSPVPYLPHFFELTKFFLCGSSSFTSETTTPRLQRPYLCKQPSGYPS